MRMRSDEKITITDEIVYFNRIRMIIGVFLIYVSNFACNAYKGLIRLFS